MAEEIKRISKIKFSNSDDEFVINDANAAATDAWAYGTDVSAIADASHAEGHGTQTGTAGYLIPLNEEGKIQIDGKQITLKNTPKDKDLEKGDIISIQANGYYQWLDVAEITEINGNIITCNTEIPLPNDEREHKAGVLFVAAKPKLNGDTIIGLNSHAEGFETCALADESHAEGYSTVAAGRYAHTEGCETKAAYASHAEGYGTEATNLHSHAEGYLTKASGKNSHAEGNKTQATHNQTHAEGYNTIASGACSHTEGYETTAESHSGHAEGYQTKAIGQAAHAEGYQTKATEQAAHAEGEGTIATLRGQHVQGKYNKIDSENKYAHITGWGNNENSRQNIHTLDTEGNAWFKGTVKSGENFLATEAFVQEEIKKAEGLDLSKEAGKIAEGYIGAEIFNIYKGNNKNIATGNYSHAEGQNTVANGQASHVEGYKNVADGFDTHAEGYYTVASGDVQHVEGRYNIEDKGKYDISGEKNPNAQVKYGKYAHIVGNGTAKEKRSNAHTLDWDGNAWYQGDIYSGGIINGNEYSKSYRIPKIYLYNNTPNNTEGKKGDIAICEITNTVEIVNDSTLSIGSYYRGRNLDASWASDNNEIWIGEQRATQSWYDYYHKIVFTVNQKIIKNTNIDFIFSLAGSNYNNNYNTNISSNEYDNTALLHSLQWYKVSGFIGPVDEKLTYDRVKHFLQSNETSIENVNLLTEKTNATENKVSLKLTNELLADTEYALYFGRAYTDYSDGFTGATRYYLNSTSAGQTATTQNQKITTFYIKGNQKWYQISENFIENIE